MHELSVTKGIVNTVLKSLPEDFSGKVSIINLLVGEMYDYEEDWLNSYLVRLSQGTKLEGARLSITRQGVSFKCKDCGQEFDSDGSIGQTCPKCGSGSYGILTGREFYIQSVECIED